MFAEMQLIIDLCAKWALINQYGADAADKQCMSSGGTACINDSIQIGIKGNSASIWPKKPNTVRMCSSSFALTYCCSLIQSTSTDGALFEPLAVWWAWRTQGRLSPLPGHTQELRTQGRAHGIFFPAFWGTGDLSQDGLC